MGIASRKRGNASSESEDTELYSASDYESSEDDFEPVLYRKAKRRIMNASSASSTATVRTAPQRWPHSILFVPQTTTANLRILNRQALSLYLENIVPNEIKDIRINTRKNILAIDVRNPSALNTLQHVSELGNIKVRSIIPANGDTVTGVIYDIDTEIANEDLPVLIKPVSENNVIVHAGRLGNSRCVRITFKGDCLPSYVKVGHFRHQVRPFIPKPMQCFKCQKIGHVKGVCRNSAVCPRCAEHHSEDDCNATTLKCPNCQGAHSASSKDCPQIKKEIYILRQMVRDNSTHREAAQKVRRRRRHRRRSSRRTVQNLTRKSETQVKSTGAAPSTANICAEREDAGRSLSPKEWPPLQPRRSVEPQQKPPTRPVEPQQKPPQEQAQNAATTGKPDHRVMVMLRSLVDTIRMLLSDMNTPSAKSALQVLDALSPVLAALE